MEDKDSIHSRLEKAERFVVFVYEKRKMMGSVAQQATMDF